MLFIDSEGHQIHIEESDPSTSKNSDSTLAFLAMAGLAIGGVALICSGDSFKSNPVSPRARKPKTPPSPISSDASQEELFQLAETKDRALAMQILEHDNVVWAMPTNEDSFAVLNKLARNFPNEVFESGVVQFLLMSGDNSILEVIVEVARSSRVSPTTLEILAIHESSIVRSTVGRSKSAPEPVLRQLSQDRDKWVRLSVAKNEKTPEDVLVSLSRESDGDIRWSSAMNQSLPLSRLNEMKLESNDRKLSAAIRLQINRRLFGDP